MNMGSAVVAFAATVAAASIPMAGGCDAPAQEREIDETFTSELDETQQQYVVRLPPKYDPADACDVLVALHGHGSDRWQFIRDGRDECRSVRDFASRRGMILVSPDYRASTSWMGPAAEADLVQILETVRKDYRVDRVFVCGGSMGGTSALTFAARRPESVAGVVAMNGTANHFEYERFQDAIRASFGGTKIEIPDEYKRRSAEYWPERLTMPLASTVGDRDDIVPGDSVVRLCAVLRRLERPALLIRRAEGGHSTSYDDATTALEFVVNAADGAR